MNAAQKKLDKLLAIHKYSFKISIILSLKEPIKESQLEGSNSLITNNSFQNGLAKVTQPHGFQGVVD